ncbi:MAG: amino acid adenylation domain-containing protein [Pseudomonadota bacterium]
MSADLPADLHARIRALSPVQRDALRQRFEANGLPWTYQEGEAPGEGPGADLPLTPAQQQLWVVQQLMPDNAAYHIAFRWRVDGALDLSALSAALSEVVQRHESLRTAFLRDEASGLPVQRVLGTATVALDLCPVADEAQAEDLAARCARQAFDLARPPLLRLHVLQFPQGRHDLVWVWHHLVADGWSRGVMLRELGQAYDAARAGRASALPALPTSWSRWVQDQARWLAEEDCARQTAWWATQLRDLPPLSLPLDRPRERDSHWQARTVERLLPDLGSALQKAAARCGATSFMFLLTVFAAVLHRLSGQRDLAIGVPVAGRHDEHAAALIGFFVNTVVVRTRVPESARFSAWVDQLKHAVADALEHAQVPLSHVIDVVQPPREPSRNPLFDVMFQYQDAGYGAQNAQAPRFGGLPIEQSAIGLPHTKFDLTCHALAREQGLWLALEYRTALFDEARIHALLDLFEHTLQAVLETPRLPVGALPVVLGQDAVRLAAFEQGPSSAGGKASWSSFIDRFEAQVAATPDKVAVDTPDGVCLSYRELDVHGSHLAQRLRAQGIGRESLVGVCLPRHPSLMVALLGVLKAGAAYLALDPVLPDERLRYMLADSRAAMLLTSAEVSSRLQAPDVPLLCLDDVRTGLPASADSRDVDASLLVRDLIVPDQLAYVLYTSGSTGAPKGTLLTHGGLMHYLDWCLARYPLRDGQGAPVNSSIGFDATITGLFGPLLAGGRVSLLPERDPLSLLADAMSAGHGLVKITPAHMQALAPLMSSRPAVPVEQLPRAFVIGGEALTESHTGFWQRHYPSIALLNEYGPTETVVGCCVHEVGPDDQGNLPIGRPIQGAAMYILDDDFNRVPLGSVGEIFIGGPGMARGYLGRPGLSASRFLPDPFWPRGQGAVMYRTGDLARWRDDGVMEYLGRIDQQLKLRGHRIEAGEVESALTRIDGIAEAVVGIRQVGLGQALVAWVRSDHATDLPPLELVRGHLARWLPAYMVPSHIVPMDSLPLTTNGKVDRGALPLPEIQASRVEGDEGTSEIMPGANGQESDSSTQNGPPALVDFSRIWREVLGRAEVRPGDNFFDLGGDSISAMQIVAQAQRAGWRIAPASLFEHQTLLAQARAAQPLVASDSTVQADTRPGEPVPLTPAAWRFLRRVEEGQWPEPDHFNQSLLLDVDSAIDPDRLREALQTLPARHAALRLRFTRDHVDVQTGPEVWHVSHVDIAEVPLSLHDLSDHPVSERQAALDTLVGQAQRTLNLAKGPLLAAHLIRLGDQPGSGQGLRLLLAAHHLVVDGVSWRLLLADLLAALASPGSGDVHQAPAFATWARHQAQAGRQPDALAAERWQAWLAADGVAARPATAPAPALEADVRETVQELDADTTRRLLEAAQGALKATPEELLLTALAQTLSAWLRHGPVTVAVEGHGRPSASSAIDAQPEVAGMVGWFTTELPLSVAMPNAAPLRQLQAVQGRWRTRPAHVQALDRLQMQGGLSLPVADCGFNHLGRVEFPAMGVLRGLAPEPVVAQRCPQGVRDHALQLVTLIDGDRLRMVWRHDAGQHRAALIDQLARRCVANLRTLLSLQSASA